LATSVALALAIHLSARTMAFASACAVFGYFCVNSIGAYRQPAGSAAPHTSCVPFRVRVSAITLTALSSSSLVMTGSVLEMASIWPLFIAEMAPAPTPTPTIAASLFGSRPPLASSCLTRLWVLEPGALTPIFRPLRSLKERTCPALALATPKAICGSRPCSTKARKNCFFDCRLMVCS
jgi:hypothetical protein